MPLPTHNQFMQRLADVSEEKDCPIHLGPIDRPFTTTCGHTFCVECATTWFRDHSTCPCDRTVLYGDSQRLELQDQSSNEDQYTVVEQQRQRVVGLIGEVAQAFQVRRVQLEQAQKELKDAMEFIEELMQDYGSLLNRFYAQHQETISQRQNVRAAESRVRDLERALNEERAR